MKFSKVVENRCELLIRHTAMRQACIQFNIFQSNDTVQNKREGLYTQKAGKG